MTDSIEDRIYALALGVAGDAIDGDILGAFEREDEDAIHDVVFHTTLGMCDEDPVLSEVDALEVSIIADEAIADYRLNNPR